MKPREQCRWPWRWSSLPRWFRCSVRRCGGRRYRGAAASSTRPPHPASTSPTATASPPRCPEGGWEFAVGGGWPSRLRRRWPAGPVPGRRQRPGRALSQHRAHSAARCVSRGIGTSHRPGSWSPVPTPSISMATDRSTWWSLRRGENVILRGLGGCRFERADEDLWLDPGEDWTTAFSATWEAGATFRRWPSATTRRSTSQWELAAGCADHRLFRPLPR